MLTAHNRPEGGGIGIEVPKHKNQWTCAFKCVPGQASHEPLIDLAKENADAVKAEIDHKVSRHRSMFRSWQKLTRG